MGHQKLLLLSFISNSSCAVEPCTLFQGEMPCWPHVPALLRLQTLAHIRLLANGISARLTPSRLMVHRGPSVFLPPVGPQLLPHGQSLLWLQKNFPVVSPALSQLFSETQVSAVEALFNYWLISLGLPRGRRNCFFTFVLLRAMLKIR